MKKYEIVVLCVIGILVILLLIKKRKREGFSHSEGGFVVSWNPPSISTTSNLSYNLVITDTNGNTVVNVTQPTTSYVFKNGEWNTSYTASVTTITPKHIRSIPATASFTSSSAMYFDPTSLQGIFLGGTYCGACNKNNSCPDPQDYCKCTSPDGNATFYKTLDNSSYTSGFLSPEYALSTGDSVTELSIVFDASSPPPPFITFDTDNSTPIEYTCLCFGAILYIPSGATILKECAMVYLPTQSPSKSKNLPATAVWSYNNTMDTPKYSSFPIGFYGDKNCGCGMFKHPKCYGDLCSAQNVESMCPLKINNGDGLCFSLIFIDIDTYQYSTLTQVTSFSDSGSNTFRPIITKGTLSGDHTSVLKEELTKVLDVYHF